ncbi:MAG: hypothetical protein AVO34_02365 [Firmicutes bacterium ML8_F2]|jgi:ribose 5-phosphate isomerase B|nr:MAG: hypothetical protein AVO34_02365 [Firmicutes bacterium ML8_F2]
MIYLGADHAGFNLKEELKKYLEELGHEYEDLGNKKLELEDDYPDFASAVAEKTVENNGQGILICATGFGMAMAANKMKGVRAAVCWDDFTALQSREHNNANVLCLGSKIVDSETAKKIVRIWIKTEFSGDERHVRRLNKIEEMEQ